MFAKNLNLPLNVDLISLSKKEVENLKEIKSLQIFDSNNNFHAEGLFSTTIFGSVGSEYRTRMFGYINLKYEFLHPLIYYCVIKLKGFYGRIIEGKETAIWNKEELCFEPSLSSKAETGFSFFMKHFKDIKYDKTESVKRDFLISTIEKAIKENTYTCKYLLVMPAGLRDYVVDATGKPQEDEINSYYRKLMFQSNLIDEKLVKLSEDNYNSVFASIQKQLLELFNYIKDLLEGKNKLILGKWLTRKVFNSTRNVLTSNTDNISTVDDVRQLKYNETLVGINQFLKAAMPKTIYEIKNKYLSKVFTDNAQFCTLVNRTTLKKEQVYTTEIQKDIQQWTSMEGIEKIIANFANLNLRHLPILLNNNKHYLGLLYSDDKYFRFFQDIDELPESFSKDHVKPISFAELLYMSVYQLNGHIPAFITRYPVIEFGSIYPSYLKIKTTVNDLVLEELDDKWQPSGFVASSFPIPEVDFYNTVSAHTSHWEKMSADADGDTLSVTAVLTDEARVEIENLLHTREYYIDGNNSFNFGIGTDISNSVLSYMTR